MDTSKLLQIKCSQLSAKTGQGLGALKNSIHEKSVAKGYEHRSKRDKSEF